MGKSHRDKPNKGKFHDRRRDEEAFADLPPLPAIVVPRPAVVVTRPTVPPPRHCPAAVTEDRTSDLKVLHSETFRGDGKIFYLDAVENDRGKALKIVEVSKGRRTMLMVPALLLQSFLHAQTNVTPFLGDKPKTANE